MDQKDKRNIRDDGRKPGTDTRDSRGQQGQRDRSRDSESAGQNHQMQSGQHQSGQHQPGQQQAGQRQMPGQQQAGQADGRHQESGQQGSGPGNKPHQGDMDRDKDRQR